MDTANATRRTIPSKTLVEFGTEKLSALFRGAGLKGEGLAAVDVFRQLLEPWGDRVVGRRPQFASNVADDGAPFEFSIAVSRSECELQFYVEAQGEPPSLRSNLGAGRALLERVFRDRSTSSDRFRAVESLFLPDDPRGAFTIWIGASFVRGRPPQYKVYLNPAVQGAGARLGLVDDAMARLGFSRSWSAVRETLAAGAARHDEVAILCLDLAASATARVKLYIRHHGAAVRDIDAFARVAADYRASDVATFFRWLAPGTGPFLRRPALTELSFVERDAAQPDSVTLEFPIGSYVGHDGEARERVERCLRAFELPTEAYVTALRAFSSRPLDWRRGIHEHVTLRRVPVKGRLEPRVALYFATEAYDTEPLEER